MSDREVQTIGAGDVGTISAAELVKSSQGYRGITHAEPLSDMTGASFLPMLQFLSSKSEAVSGGRVDGHGYYVKTGRDKFIPMGKEVIIYPITFRRLAIDASGRPDKIITIYDSSDPEYDRIKEDSNVQDSSCMWGPQFLVWVPDLKLKKKFATFFCSSKSMRNEAGNFDPILAESGFAKLGWNVLKNTKYTWQNITVNPYTGQMDLPSQDDLLAEVAKFQSPPKRTEMSDTKEAEEIEDAVDESEQRPR